MEHRYLKRYIMSRCVPEEVFNTYDPESDAKPPLHAEIYEKWMWVKEWLDKKLVEYPLFLDIELKERTEKYFRLMEERPELFSPLDGKFPICRDLKKILSFQETNKDKRDRNFKVGVMFDNSPFYMVVSDLIEGDKPYTYARIVYPAECGGTVIVPIYTTASGESKFILIKNMRHPIRKESLEFPRGFLEDGCTENENALKELSEELSKKTGFSDTYVETLSRLGDTYPDSGLSSARVSIYLAHLKKEIDEVNTDEEGITGYITLTETELSEKIKNGEITDGLTQNAFLMYLSNKKEA